MNLRERALLIDALGSAIADGGISLGQVPELLCKVLKEGAWRDFETQLGKHVIYEQFKDFVEKPPLDGLGASIDLIRRIVKDDRVALDELDKAIGNHQGARTDLQTNFGLNQSEVSKEKRDRSGEMIRRLRKDFPELHKQVLSGKLTTYAASVQAGIYPARISINLNDAKSAAATLKTKGSPEFLDELRASLEDK